MDWWHKVKDQKSVVVAAWICGSVVAIGTFLGAINSIAEFVGLGWFDGADGWIANTYNRLTGWLAFQISLPVWALLPALAVVVYITIRLRIDRTQMSQSLALATTELEALKQPKPLEPITLSSVQESVLFWAVLLYDTQHPGANPIPRLLAEVSGQTLTTVEAALDALVQKGVVKMRLLKFAPVELTPEGRTYIGSEIVSPRYESFKVLATKDISYR